MVDGIALRREQYRRWSDREFSEVSFAFGVILVLSYFQFEITELNATSHNCERLMAGRFDVFTLIRAVRVAAMFITAEYMLRHN